MKCIKVNKLSILLIIAVLSMFGCKNTKKEANKVEVTEKRFPSDVLPVVKECSLLCGDGTSFKNLNKVVHDGFFFVENDGKAYNWQLNLSEIARIWTNGCITKSDLIAELTSVLKEDDNILKHQVIINQIKVLKPSINKVVAACVMSELAIPCLSDAVNFLNNYANSRSSANIIQAQRDYFGAHTYQRTDDATGKFYHTNW